MGFNVEVYRVIVGIIMLISTIFFGIGMWKLYKDIKNKNAKPK